MIFPTLSLYNKCPADCFLKILWPVTMTNGNGTSRVGTAEEEDSWRGGEPALDGLPGHKAQGLDRWEGSRRPGDHQAAWVVLGTCLACLASAPCWGTRGRL